MNHRHPSLAIRLLGSATLLLALPASALPAATPAPVQMAQAQPPASQPAPLTVPVQQAPAKPDAAPDESQRRGDDRRAYVEAGIAALHAGLLLTPAQQTLWPPVETALRDLAATRGGMRHHREDGRREDEGRREQGDPLARLKQRGARLVARGQAMGKLADAAGPLLAALTPEQKERVPRLLHRIMARPTMDGRGMHGGRRGMETDGMGDRGMGDRGMGERDMGERGMGERGREGARRGDGERFGRGEDRP